MSDIDLKPFHFMHVFAKSAQRQRRQGGAAKNRVRHGAVANMDDLDPRIVCQDLRSPRMTLSDGTRLIRKRGAEAGQEREEKRGDAEEWRLDAGTLQSGEW